MKTYIYEPTLTSETAMDLLSSTYKAMALSGKYSMEMLTGMSALMRQYHEGLDIYNEPLETLNELYINEAVDFEMGN